MNPNYVLRSLFDKDVVFVLRTPLQVEPMKSIRGSLRARFSGEE
jgi:hypothetical protein